LAERADGSSRGETALVSTHRLWLVLCAGALLAAVAIGQVERWLPVFSLDDLPVACAFRRTTGLPCPGCGLTRSWAALGRGDLAQSLAYHRLGWVVMLYVAAQALRHAFWLAFPATRAVTDRWGRWLDRSLLVLAAAMFINWGLVLVGV
jgi:hypothetical protein